MIVASSTGAADTSQTRWPASRCARARASVWPYTLPAILSSKTSRPISTTSLTSCPATKPSATSVASAISVMSSVPASRNFSWPFAKPMTSRFLKKPRWARPSAR